MQKISKTIKNQKVNEMKKSKKLGSKIVEI